jgi:hypothetical protein
MIQTKGVDDTQEVQSGNADFAVVEDQDCQQGQNEVEINKANLWEWIQSKAKSKVQSFKETYSKNSLASSILSTTLYDVKIRRECEDRDSCQKAEVARDMSALRICKKESKYQRMSLESVGLSATAHLNNAYEFYQTLSNHRFMNLATLVVHPKITRVTKKSGSFEEVNNAYFMPPASRNSPAAFFVLPMSKIHSQVSDVKYWEVPFVLAHEFGHYVTHTHLNGDVALSNRGIMRGPASSLKDSPSAESQVRVSFDEAVADLFAKYALGDRDDILAGVTCLDVSRDPTRSMFLDGTPKVLDQKALDILYGKSKMDRPDSCQTPYWKDPHDVAAVLAHGVHSFLSLDKNLDSKTRAEAVVAWVESLGKSSFFNSADASRIVGVAQDFVDAYEAYSTRKATSEQCAVWKRVLPDTKLSGTCG